MENALEPEVTTPLIVAIDKPDADSALQLVEQLDPSLCRLKVGKELFTAAGPALVASLQQLGYEIFLDLKFHDIPATVAGAVRSAASLGVWMVNVHASGGRRMLEAAAEALSGHRTRPRLIAVTVLTSIGSEELFEVIGERDVESQVSKLAQLSNDCGLDGVVCSAREATALRRVCGPCFTLVTPGIRPAGAAGDDQTRIVTPADALRRGADYLVIGRPVTRAEEPGNALRAIAESLT